MSQIAPSFLANSPLKSTGGSLQTLFIDELAGSKPISLDLSGGLLPQVGAELSSEARGSTYTPLGSANGTATITGLTYGSTDFTFAFDAAFMRPAELGLKNLSIDFTPEGVLGAFQTLQARGRECTVLLGTFSRRGVVRKVSTKPGRGYTVDPATGSNGFVAGMNLEVVVTFEWTGLVAPPVKAAPPTSGFGLSGQLAGVTGSIAALSDLTSFNPNVIQAIQGAIGNVRNAISQLRGNLQQVGDLAKAPGQLASQILAAARSLGNVLNDLNNLVSDTRAEYLALGGDARSVADLLKARRTCSGIRAGCQDGGAAVAAIFDAIEKKRTRTVSVQPGQSLGQVAKANLGSSDRWPEISALNSIAGQVVPAGVTSVQIPGA